MKTNDARESVFRIVNEIPFGKVLSYGEVGRLAGCTGRQVGQIMSSLDGPGPVVEHVKWWRVVAFDGNMPIAKRNPLLEKDQKERLESEGVLFDDRGKVRMSQYRWEPNESL